ncbi:MAG: TetR/AcrR family transcriptional regulator [Saprospiraceae bacterium]
MDKIKARKEQQWKDREQQILQSAKKIAHCEGWQSVSIRRIADEIAYSVPVIYSHFASKDALLGTIMQEGFQKLDERMLQAKNTTADVQEQLIQISLAQLAFALEHKELYQLMFGLGGVVCNPAHHVQEESVPALLKKIVNQLKKDDTPAKELMENWFVLVHGFISHVLRLSEPDANEAARRLKKHLERFIRSL